MQMQRILGTRTRVPMVGLCYFLDGALRLLQFLTGVLELLVVVGTDEELFVVVVGVSVGTAAG